MTTRSRMRLLAAAVVLAVFAAACGDSDETGSSSSGSDTTSASASASEMASESESASASEMASESESASASEMASESESASASEMASESESASASEMAEEAAETVVVQHFLGEVEMPVTQTGLYSLDEFTTIALLTLGVVPDTTEFFFQDFNVRPVLEAEGVNLVDVGNPEAIAVAAPEAILGIGHPNHVQNAEAHSAIAPSVYPDFTISWIDQTQVFAQVTGTTDRAAQIVAAVDNRIAELGAMVADAGLEGSNATVIQSFGGEYWAYGPTTLAGQILEQIGFTRSELQSELGQFGFIPVAEELLPAETEAAVVFGMTSTMAADDAAPPSIFDSPVVNVGDTPSGVVIDIWSGNHALAGWIILNDIESVLFGDGSTTQADDVSAAWDDLIAAIDAA